MAYYTTRYQLRRTYGDSPPTNNKENKITEVHRTTVKKVSTKKVSEETLEKQIENRVQKELTREHKKLKQFKKETDKKIEALQRRIDELERKLEEKFKTESVYTFESDDDSHCSDETYEPDVLEVSDDDEML